jgi:hypothetical protein
MYNKEKKYKKPDLEIVNQILVKITDDHADHDDLHFLVANLHQINFTKFGGWSEEEINNLLNRNNIDISIFEKEEEKEKSFVDVVYNRIIEFVTDNNGEYKSELVTYLKNNIDVIPKGKISSTLRRLKKLGILEMSIHETSKQKIISKGRYWTSHIRGDNG